MNPGDLATLANVKSWLNIGGAAVAGISAANPAVVTLLQPSGFLTGMPVVLTDVVGPDTLNGVPYPLTLLTPTTFSIPVDTTALPLYVSGGFASISDPVLQRLISALSAYVQNWLNRTIANTDYIEMRNGVGGARMCTKQFPITSVAGVSVNGLPVQARAPLAPNMTYTNAGGYVFDDISVMLSGWCFARGYQNIALQYAAGFLISDEAQTIPAVSPYTLTTFARWSAGDRGVVYASSGVALAKVTGAPNVGEYAVDGSVYTFAAADAGIGVLISYAYVPFDIEQAVIDILGDWFKYRDRIGELSKGIEGQTISFVNSAITARALGVLQQYKLTAPIA